MYKECSIVTKRLVICFEFDNEIIRFGAGIDNNWDWTGINIDIDLFVFHFSFGFFPVSWSGRKQPNVARG